MTRGQVLASTTTAHYSLLLTTDEDDVRAAQRLRYRVFAQEQGATLHSPEAGLDVDRLDGFCDHLVVRENTSGEVVGTYRILPPQRAAAAGGLYSDTEFELSAVAPLRRSLIEVGRSCVHPEHRSGAVIGLTWTGIARYLLLTGHRWLAGCASLPLLDGGGQAAAVWTQVRARHLAPARYSVTPHRPWLPPAAALVPARTSLPPLLGRAARPTRGRR